MEKERPNKNTAVKGSAQAMKKYSDSIRSRMEDLRRRTGKVKKEAINRSLLHPSVRRLMSRMDNHLANPLTSGRPFKVQQIISDTSFLTNNLGGAGAAKNFQLDQFLQFASFAAVFDQYRFTKVKCHLYPRANTNNLTVMSSVTTLTLSPIIIAWDPDDSNVPTVITDVTGYPNATLHPGYQPIEHTFKPRAAIAAFGSTVFTQFADFDGWVDCASDDTEYYALKAWALGDGASQTTHQIWDLVSYVEAEFRFVH